MIKLYPNDEWEEETLVQEDGRHCFKARISSTMSIVLPISSWRDEEEFQDICQAFSECVSGERAPSVSLESTYHQYPNAELLKKAVEIAPSSRTKTLAQKKKERKGK